MSSPTDVQPLHPSHTSTPTSSTAPDLPPKKKKVCSGFTVCKVLVLFYGFIFLIIGLLLLAIGIWVLGVHREQDTITYYLQAPSILSLVVGIVMIFTAFCGIFGALFENVCLLKTYLAVIICVFLVQVIIGILAFIYRQEAFDVVENHWKHAIETYDNEDEYTKLGVDSIQKKFDCCGMENRHDWEINPHFKCKTASNFSCGVPASCCKNSENEYCGVDGRYNSTANINQMGCTHYFMMWVQNHLDWVGATALGFAIPQILGMFLVYIFIQKVQDRQYLFKYRKRIYQG